MEIKIPIHPKKSTCIGCGVSVGSKALGRVKKAFSVGTKKALEFWMTQEVAVHHHDHKLCNSCYENEKIIIQWKTSSNSVDISALCELLTKSLHKQAKTESNNVSESEQNCALDGIYQMKTVWNVVDCLCRVSNNWHRTVVVQNKLYLNFSASVGKEFHTDFVVCCLERKLTLSLKIFIEYWKT